MLNNRKNTLKSHEKKLRLLEILTFFAANLDIPNGHLAFKGQIYLIAFHHSWSAMVRELVCVAVVSVILMSRTRGKHAKSARYLYVYLI